jgi:hypothetical protein
VRDREELIRFLAAELAQPVSPGAHALAARLRETHGEAVRAVVFYGSCLRRNDDEGVLDLYVLVDRYRDLYGKSWLSLLNAALPPNVFYLETPVDGRRVRAKYAVVSLDDFERVNSASRFESYFWARFAQPCALVYAADAATAARVTGALADAVLTLIRRVLPLVAERVEVLELWKRALAETYRTEIRAERGGASAHLLEGAADRYAAITGLALPALPYPVKVGSEAGAVWLEAEVPARERRAAPLLWGLRRVVGKSLFLLRLLRNGLTFDGGLDYLAWKIERHSGVAVDPSWRERRFRLASFCAEVVRLYRRGAFR